MAIRTDLIRWTTEAASLLELDPPEWEHALMLGRRHGVSGRWYSAIIAQGGLDSLPSGVSRQLKSDHLIANDRMRSARWEVNRLRHALSNIEIEPVLLKGAAYIAAGLRAGHNRMLTDVDILVPLDSLKQVEETLQRHGWRPTSKDDYDERYYRDWMHELPPFRHALRGSVVDVHHNILPRTSDLCPDASLLLARSRTLEGDAARVLCPVDMVLHSVLHGFYGGELTNCFRDVLDVFELCSDFERTEHGFWDDLTERALAMRAARPVWLALRQLRHFHAAGVPDHVLTALASSAGSRAVRRAIEATIDSVLLPHAPPTLTERMALKVLLARAHTCKMPMSLLMPHLARKLRLRYSQPVSTPSTAQ